MLSELLQKIEGEHGIPPEKATGVINTIVEHLKEKFPQVGGMLDSALGTQTASPSTGTTPDASGGNESMLGKLEDLAKSKLGGLFGGNK